MILRKSSVVLLMLLSVITSSCLKEEIAVAKHLPGDIQTNEIALGQDYRNQLYFSLGRNEVVKSNLKTDWDLAFESVGNHIVLNTGKGMAVHRSELSIESITSEADLDWNWDAHSGDLDETAFGNWWENDFVYVVDRGYAWDGTHQGYAKIKIVSYTEDVYEIMYAVNLNTAPISLFMERSLTEQFVYFKFEEGKVVIAPNDKDYDLIFTQYTHLFTDPLTPYLVTGICLNRGFTSVARLDEKAFAEINLEDVEGLTFGYDLDEIGYDWKYYSLEDGVFTTNSDQHYVVKSQKGVFYKLRIMGFYNSEGLKGYPSIEFQAL